MEDIIVTIQKNVIGLLSSIPATPLHESAKDNCSEMSRLVACWVLNAEPQAEVDILKGINVLNTGESHDVVVVRTKQFYLIDPTVWQFFDNRESILIGVAENLTDIFGLLTSNYGGKWSVSEPMTTEHCLEITNWERVIRQNIANE